MPLAAPESKTVSVFNESAHISWHPIPCGKRGGNITGYAYELRDSLGSLVGAGNTMVEFVWTDGLSPGAIYSFRVQAITTIGPGPWMTVNVEVPQGVRLGFTLTNMNSSIELTFRLKKLMKQSLHKIMFGRSYLKSLEDCTFQKWQHLNHIVRSKESSSFFKNCRMINFTKNIDATK